MRLQAQLTKRPLLLAAMCFTLCLPHFAAPAFAQQKKLAAPPAAAAEQGQESKKPNIVILMTDDTGWNDFGAYSGGGAGLGHPTPNVDRIAKEGAVFTNWYGQASCTAGRASFMTGRMPIRSALSIVVAPGDENRLKKQTPTIAEFFQKNGYTTYFSGKWHMGDKPDAYPTEHGFEEMKHFAAYYAGVYSYNDTSKWFHPWFPSYNPEYNKMYDDIVNLGEWEGLAGKPANGWVLSLIYPVILAFDKSIMKYPSITRVPGGASNDLVPNLQHPENPVPLLKGQKEPRVGGGDG